MSSVRHSRLTPSQYSAIVSIAQEWYMDIPKNVETRPLSELLDTANVRVFFHGRWMWCVENKIIWYKDFRIGA